MAMPGSFDQSPQRWQPGGGPPPNQASGPMGNPGAGPPQFGPPPMQGMPRISGYEQVGGFGQMNFMPPPPPPPPPQGKPPPMEFTNLANLNEEDCRNAMIQFVSENCCYGSAPAKEMNITNVIGLTALHYTLETFCESRRTGYVHEPYRGGPVDGPQNGPAPPPWQMHCVANTMFSTHEKKMEVPHTATVMPCHACDARGYHVCWRCHGIGHTRCDNCNGSGQRHTQDPHGNPIVQMCHHCHGDGRERCHTCGGDGRITCDECDGYRNIKSYIQLTVTFTNHKVDHIIERSDMPDELVRHVSGDIIFEQVLPQVWPITAYPVPEINDNSVRLVNQHKGAFPNERQLQQRQQLRAVPVTEAHYEWNDVKTRFWVYGLEKKVEAPDYPQQCCWGCEIL